jgi:hypothetical protein
MTHTAPIDACQLKTLHRALHGCAPPSHSLFLPGFRFFFLRTRSSCCSLSHLPFSIHLFSRSLDCFSCLFTTGLAFLLLPDSLLSHRCIIRSDYIRLDPRPHLYKPVSGSLVSPASFVLANGLSNANAPPFSVSLCVTLSFSLLLLIFGLGSELSEYAVACSSLFFDFLLFSSLPHQTHRCASIARLQRVEHYTGILRNG